MIVGQPSLNLYYTNLIINNKDTFQHDCLRLIETNRYVDQNVQIMSFCLNENASMFGIKDDDKTSKFTFVQLFEKNVTVEQLFYWSAPIDIVEKYQDYLDTNNIILKEEIFYNCTLQRFGDRCQYEFTTLISKDESLYNNLYKIFETYEFRQMPVTCYKHIECNRGGSTTCLDWRDICNGQIDCLNDGIDEKDCWQLQIKQCKENEYRCSNSQCMPLVIASRIEMFHELCFKIQHYADYHIRSSYKACSKVYNLFKECDDMICITNFVNPSCHRNHQSLILMAIDSNENGSLSNNCSLAFACILMPFMCTKFCQKSQCIQIVQDHCPEAFLFPDIPILFGNIYFGYMKKDFIHPNGPSLIEPYICYNTTDYDDFFRYSSTFLINNIRCVDANELYVRLNQSNPPMTQLDYIDDLHRALQRYHLSMNYTTEICNRSNMYQCIGSSKCISMYSILDGIIDCPHMDDENISLINTSFIIKYIEKNYFKCQSTNRYIPQIFVGNFRCDCRGEKEDDEYCEDEHPEVNYIKTNILFQHICDTYSELLPILIDGNNHTDETECQQWECNNIYTHCNNEWNCPHLEDEINCPHIPKISFNLNCSSNSHPCVSTQMYQSICLPIEKINDGSIDCFGATDEVYDRRISVLVDNQKDNFYCINQNSSLPISIFRLCDDKQDCEYGDDERFCTTNRTYSEYGICAASNIERASDVEKLLCYTKSHARKWQIVEYKMPPINNDEKNNEQQFKSSMFSSELSRKYVHPCHLGLPIRVWINPKNKSFILTCFCPTRYYGPQCQYQNQRISLTLQFQTLSDSWNILFMIVVSLIDDSNEKVIHSYESFTYLAIQNCGKFFFLTLYYSTRPKDITKQYFIRIDVYEKLTLHHRGSSLFPIEFSFLPVHRLGFLVDIPSNKTQC